MMSSTSRKRPYGSVYKVTQRKRTQPSFRYPTAQANAMAAIVARSNPSLSRASLQEVKCCDMNLAAAAALGLLAAVAGTEPAAAYTGLTEVNLVRQGATVAERIGNKIMIKSIQLTFELACVAAANQGMCRAMLIYDKQPNKAFPAIGDVILSQPGAVVHPLSGINIANKSRFQMIRDEYINMDSGTGLAQTRKWYCKGRWETEFGANGGTIGDINTGAMYFICYYLTAITAPPNVQYMAARVRYYD